MLKSRNPSLDLFRVLIMFMIVFGHSMVHGLGGVTVEYFTTNWFIENILLSFLYVHVDCFVLLSGYLGYQKKFSFQKLLKLWVEVFFWSVVLFFVVTIIQGNGFQLKELLKSLTPITHQRYWFMTTYLLMYILTPLLNTAISYMDEALHRRVLLLYLLFFIVLQNVAVWDEFTATGNYSPLFFCFLYMTGAYFHKYPVKRKIPWWLVYAGSCSLIAIYKILITAVTLPRFGEPMGETLMSGYCSVLVVLGAVGLFMSFVTMKHTFGKRSTKIFAFLSPLTLGVYLIHDNASLRAPLWEALNLGRFINCWYFVFALLAASIVIFALCLLLEWIRAKLFQCCKIDALAARAGGNFDQLFDCLCTK